MKKEEKDYISVTENYISTIENAIRVSHETVMSNNIQMGLLKKSNALEKRRMDIERRRIVRAKNELEVYKKSLA